MIEHIIGKLLNLWPQLSDKVELCITFVVIGGCNAKEEATNRNNQEEAEPNSWLSWNLWGHHLVPSSQAIAWCCTEWMSAKGLMAVMKETMTETQKSSHLIVLFAS
jgi:hypothetical protein